MQDRYTDSCAKSYAQRADDHAKVMDRETNREWDKDPVRCDAWRINLFLADVEEAHGKMIHGNTLFKEYQDEKIREELAEHNEWFGKVSEEWSDRKFRLMEIQGLLEKKVYDQVKQEREAREEEQARKERIEQLKKGAYLHLGKK